MHIHSYTHTPIIWATWYQYSKPFWTLTQREVMEVVAVQTTT